VGKKTIKVVESMQSDRTSPIPQVLHDREVSSDKISLVEQSAGTLPYGIGLIGP
jgi:hypothetical protein